MKALRVEMLDVKPMTMEEALQQGLECIVPTSQEYTTNGYAVSDDEQVKWYADSLFNDDFFLLSGDGNKIIEEDVRKFITTIDTCKVGDKTTVINAHTLTGFDMVHHSSCVDPNNYNEEIGKKYALETAISDLWGHLGFVLQWAKFGIKRK